MRNIKRLNEEISRWTFEILFKQNQSWHIAFTNPTAGPWKTIKGRSLSSSIEGEVYRFTLEEKRPDIIMYNDELKKIIVFEAKDSISKLLDDEQSTKSAEVVVKLAEILFNRSANIFWRGRESYNVILGLLWGSVDFPANNLEKDKLFDCYHNLIVGRDHVMSDIIIGIETLYKNNNLTCNCYYKSYNNYPENIAQLISASLTKSG